MRTEDGIEDKNAESDLKIFNQLTLQQLVRCELE